MAWPSNYGRLWGQIPNTAGQVFWVAPADSYTVNGISYPASDNHDGLAPNRALRTVDRAWNLVTANAGDVIVLLPGTHTVSDSSVAADVAGVTMTGLPSGRGNWVREKTILTTDITADEVINVSAANIEFANFTLRPITASDAMNLSADADGFYMHDFSIDMATPVVSASTLGITIGAASNVCLEDFYVECDGAQGVAISTVGVLDSVIRRFTMAQSAGTWGAAIQTGAGTDRLHIDQGFFLPSNATLTAGISGTGATIASGVLVTRCMFADSVTVAIDNYDGGECEIAENYQLGVGAGDGGVLVTAIT